MAQMSVYQACAAAADELCRVGQLRPGDMAVVGCSTSEVQGQRIGSAGTLELAEQILQGLLEGFAPHGVVLATQCCEHLNRALVLPRRTAEALGLTEVCVLPQPHAGGSLSTAYYQSLEEPFVAETIQAKAGLDIGDTLIGMHLRRVAVPRRLQVSSIGQAHLVAATTRPPLIGGARAKYPDPSLR